MEKIPCIKCTSELWKYIRPYLEEWKYKISGYHYEHFDEFPYIVLNDCGKFGVCSNYEVPNEIQFNRELVTDVEEFLERAAKLKGFTYKRKDMEFHGIEIKAGMIIVIDEPNVDNVPYIVFPRANELGVVKYGITACGIWFNLEEFIIIYCDNIKRIYDKSKDKHVLFGDIIWEKGPKEVVLTMDEIAKKFGIPVEQLRIEK